ncbi:TMEM175 family protein [Micromonosporaceae bacterium Da 78-11]
MADGTAAAEVEAEVAKVSAERLVFFSDAVIAIAITLLALELPLPVGETAAEAWRSLGDRFDEYLAFLVSFAVIGTQWLSHHSVFRYLNRTSRALGRLNLLWLLMVVVTPFATRVLVGETPFVMAFTLYSAVQAASALVMALIVVVIRCGGLSRPGTPSGFYREATLRSFGLATGFLLAIPVAYFTQWAYAVWALVPVLLGFARRRWWSRAKA